jgi:hypothetical protein
MREHVPICFEVFSQVSDMTRDSNTKRPWQTNVRGDAA